MASPLAASLGVLCAIPAAWRQEPFAPPDVTFIGVATSRGTNLDGRWSLVEEMVERQGGTHARLRWLGKWSSVAEEEALRADIAHVIVFRTATTKAKKPITHEYGKVFGRDGRTARVRFTGATSEVVAELHRHRGEWEEIGGWSQVEDPNAPSTIEAADGNKEELVIDPERQLASLLASAVAGSADFFAARELWDARAELARIATDLSSSATVRTWRTVLEVLPASSVPPPRASLCEAAALGVEGWSALLQAAPPVGLPEGSCEWCGGSRTEQAACTCEDSLAFAALLDATDALLGNPARDPESGARRIAEVAPTLSRLARSLRDLSSQDAKEFTRRFESFDTVQPRVGDYVLVAGAGTETALPIDADHAPPALELLERVRDDYASKLEEWDIDARIPFAALVRRPWQGHIPVLVELVPEKRLAPPALEELIRRAMWARFEMR